MLNQLPCVKQLGLLFSHMINDLFSTIVTPLAHQICAKDYILITLPHSIIVPPLVEDPILFTHQTKNRR